MNMPEDSMNHIHLINDTIIGNQIWKGKEDLVNIVMIGLAKRNLSQRRKNMNYTDLLGALLSETLKRRGKIRYTQK